MHGEQPSDPPTGALPPKLGKPAERALAGAGYQRLEQFTGVTVSAVLALHGVGPNAVSKLRLALAANGLSFAGEEDT